MKPVVSALNAWSCTVISGFAIVILSIIGGLFKRNDRSMMGSEEDPEDGAAVASAVFSAVIVYARSADYKGYFTFERAKRELLRYIDENFQSETCGSLQGIRQNE